MIVPMTKYAFLVAGSEYPVFLEELRRQGLFHAEEIHREWSPGMEALRLARRRVEEGIRLLEGRKAEPVPEADLSESGMEILEQLQDLQEDRERLSQQLQQLEKEYKTAAVWGNFSHADLEKLAENGIELRFYAIPGKDFNPAWKTSFALEIVREAPPMVYFVQVARLGEPTVGELTPIPAPGQSPAALQGRMQAIRHQLEKTDKSLDYYAASGVSKLRALLVELEDEADLEQVRHQSALVVEEKVCLLKGFVPRDREEAFEDFCRRSGLVYLRAKPKPADPVPVLLKNNRFSRLFEPIGELFSLPAYAELDLTPFFAPFFMMFFGLCLGDAGYGLLVLLGITLYKARAKENMKPVLTLGQWLGLSTVIFGLLTGTVFGINLIEASIPGLEQFKGFMLNSQQVFNFSLALGGIQILFGLVLQAVNRIRLYGLKYAISVFGWIILLLSLTDLAVAKAIAPVSQYAVWVGVGLILFFNDPDAKVIVRIGKGIWELYGITGFFGDLLSYIRLFALGVSGATLGFVINQVAIPIFDINPILGPILGGLLLVVGHTANLLLSSLGAFVHPMRLTFVEFYKNAGFQGGGKPYRPFVKRIIENQTK